MLKATGLCKSFDKQAVLKDIDFEVAPGTANIVIGPSGGGKSTLLRCLALLEFGEAGTLCVDDLTYQLPIANSRFLPPWPTLTVVFQRHFLWPHLTNYQNIALPLQRRLHPQAIREQVEELVELFGMGSFIQRYPNETSVGQQQRVALARAFALRPRYILLDEVTAALDVEQVAKLHDVIVEMIRRGIGIVLVTHLLSFAESLLRASPANRLTFLDDGRIAATGSLKLLTAPPDGRLGGFLGKMRLAG